jgi:molybdopterin synthase catalytic subunit
VNILVTSNSKSYPSDKIHKDEFGKSIIEKDIDVSGSLNRVITSEIDVQEILDSMYDPAGHSGAVMVFIGSVRNKGKIGLVSGMYYESYVEMAEKKIMEIEQSATKKWDLKRIRIVHRIGLLQLGDNSVVIAISASHSREAFEACEQILAMIKQQVPIWKKELLSDGREQWVDGKEIHFGDDIDESP